MLSQAALCLAVNLYYETRPNDDAAARIAVAMVVINRAESRNRSICQVVFRKKQFSWANNTTKSIALSQLPPANQHWQISKLLAQHTLAGKFTDMTNGATHYHAVYISKPYWTKRMQQTGTFGLHVFYK